MNAPTGRKSFTHAHLHSAIRWAPRASRTALPRTHHSVILQRTGFLRSFKPCKPSKLLAYNNALVRREIWNIVSGESRTNSHCPGNERGSLNTVLSRPKVGLHQELKDHESTQTTHVDIPCRFNGIRLAITNPVRNPCNHVVSLRQVLHAPILIHSHIVKINHLPYPRFSYSGHNH